MNTKPLFCIHWTISSLHFHIYVSQHNGQRSIGTWSWKLPWIKQPTVQLYDIVHLIQDRFLDNPLFNDQYYFFSLSRIFLAQFSYIWQATSAHWIIYPLNDYYPNLCCVNKTLYLLNGFGIDIKILLLRSEIKFSPFLQGMRSTSTLL